MSQFDCWWVVRRISESEAVNRSAKSSKLTQKTRPERVFPLETLAAEQLDGHSYAPVIESQLNVISHTIFAQPIASYDANKLAKAKAAPWLRVRIFRLRDGRRVIFFSKQSSRCTCKTPREELKHRLPLPNKNYDDKENSLERLNFINERFNSTIFCFQNFHCDSRAVFAAVLFARFRQHRIKIFFFYWLAIRWIISAVCGRYPRVLLAIFDGRFQSRFVFTAYLPAVSVGGLSLSPILSLRCLSFAMRSRENSREIILASHTKER